MSPNDLRHPLMLLLVLALLLGACGTDSSCDDPAAIPLTSGSYTRPDGKRVVIDRDAGTFEIHYTNADGQQVIERWLLGEVSVP